MSRSRSDSSFGGRRDSPVGVRRGVPSDESVAADESFDSVAVPSDSGSPKPKRARNGARSRRFAITWFGEAEPSDSSSVGGSAGVGAREEASDEEEEEEHPVHSEEAESSSEAGDEAHPGDEAAVRSSDGALGSPVQGLREKGERLCRDFKSRFLCDKLVGYACWQAEHTKSERVHVQAYLRFNNQVAFSRVLKIVPGAHVEAAKGDEVKNIEYCSKKESRVCGPFFGVSRLSRERERT